LSEGRFFEGVLADTLKLSDAEAAAANGEPIQLTPDDLVGREVGGYIVEAPLGEGGMGLVYRARHPILNRHFAIKVLRPEAAADARISVNFEREAQTLSSLKHPHIIDIVGFGTLADGRQYMVMEFVKGQTLHEELATGRIEVGRALKLADQILDGLEAAHSVGVIHRDLKPGNVLIARVSGGTEVLKLLDFGLAKQQPEALVGSMVGTSVGASVIAGTPEYIAPEQAQGKHAGKHSDLYSFGVVFFEMLTGFQPFLPVESDLDRIRSLLKMHLNEPAPLIGSLVSEGYFPLELEELVADLLKKEPSERPSSAGTVRARLQKIQRTLQREATAMVANPLLAAQSGSMPMGPRSDERIAPITQNVVAEEPARSQAWRLAAAVGLLLLLGVGGWRLMRTPEKALVIGLPPSVPSREMTAPAAPKAPPVRPAVVAVKPPEPQAPDPELVALPAPQPIEPPKKVEPKKVEPAAKPPKLTVSIANAPNPAVQINKSGCEPNDRWRAAAKANLQEIQQNAASLDKKMWAQFEDVEPSIIAAIAGASTGVECDAVETKIERLARKFKP
jgi:serine/threonine protein kinase